MVAGNMFALSEDVTNEYNDLERDEVNIISGALDLKKKTVSEVMTKLDDVFMLSYEAVLDFTTMSEIRRNGYSRIPVYERDRSNIVGVLYVKDLVLMDPDDDTPLKTLCDFYQNTCFFTFHDTTLDVIFRQFKGGDRGHMAFIQQVIDTGEKDPFYEVIGIVTLEDVIEEIIQAEIVDETDVFTDNRTKKRLRRNEARENESLFVNKRLDTKLRISPQLAMAALQYLSTSVEAFKPFRISEQILRKLLQQDIFFLIKAPKVWEGNGESSYMIYQRGKPEDYFVLILEGRAEVIVGSENLTFEAGPFTCFGMRALGFLDKDDPGPADQPRFSIFSTGAIQNSRSGSQQLNSVHFSQSQEKMSPGTEKKLLSKKPSTLARNTSHKNPSRDPPGDDTFEETALLVPPLCHSRPTLKKNKQKINNNNNILAGCSGACPHWNSCPSVMGKPPPPDNPVRKN
ncbi:unnamed protein product [Notodromas monacha]|uniref:Uncharacterized protein n=1 Tax=Notodromas monacha TaxID=399045 RepID=A0A7R9GKA0_9CRUS|nr:unnamed protein product [Notodromas monacha]CAG0923668.1 unnamed protein product [Notodromas monacha]